MQEYQVIYRKVEICEKCGAANSFRRVFSRGRGKERIIYAKCKICGHRAKVMRG